MTALYSTIQNIRQEFYMQQRVQIPLNGIELAGILFTPEYFDETKQYPAIMVVHSGGGYADNAAPIDKRIKAVANVSGIDIGWLFRDAFSEEPYATILATFEQVAQGRTAEAQGAELIVVNYVSHTSEEAASAPFAYASKAYN